MREISVRKRTTKTTVACLIVSTIIVLIPLLGIIIDSSMTLADNLFVLPLTLLLFGGYYGLHASNKRSSIVLVASGGILEVADESLGKNVRHSEVVLNDLKRVWIRTKKTRGETNDLWIMYAVIGAEAERTLVRLGGTFVRVSEEDSQSLLSFIGAHAPHSEVGYLA